MRVAILLTALLGIVVAVTVIQKRTVNEPVYEGRYLGYWLKERARSGPELAKALKVSREAGPEAVPFLCGALQAQDNFRRVGYRSFWRIMPRWIQRKFPRPISAAWIRQTAATMLGTMGTNATLAVPALTNALADPDLGVQSSAAAALRFVCPPVKERFAYQVRLDSAPRRSTNLALGRRIVYATNAAWKNLPTTATTRTNL